MTTVYVRLALDGLPPGARLSVLLAGDEPRRNVASAVRLLGHAIEADTPEGERDDGTPRYRLSVRKSPGTAASTSASPPSA